MNTKNLRGYQKFDFVIIALTLICIIFGCVAIGSAVKSYSSGTKFLIIQGGAAVIGAVMMMLISFIDYRRYKHFTAYIYVLCIMFLLAVLVIGTGRESTGSKSWIRFGSIGIQPSEIVKIGFIITFSNLSIARF